VEAAGGNRIADTAISSQQERVGAAGDDRVLSFGRCDGRLAGARLAILSHVRESECVS
jgi:hypothetical protein